MDEILRDLARLRRTGAMLQELMGELQQAAPERSEGADSTGTVRAVLGPDGLPESIRVSSYWKEKLPAAAVGAAVTAACQAAMQRRGADWADVLQRSGWQQRLEEMDTDAAGAVEVDVNPVPPAYRTGGPVPARSLDVLAEEAMSTMDAAMRPVPAAAHQPGTGANRGGTIEITLGQAGQVVCRADPGWAARQSGAQLSEALAAALTAARGQLAQASAASAASAADAGAAAAETGRQELFTEILSVLNDPEHLADR